jgi:hypothetical protein
MMTKRVLSVLVAATVAGAGLVLASPVASADTVVTMTSEQLTEEGFPSKPNTAGWGGTANLSTDTAPQWKDVIVSGRAPSGTPVGQILTMQRFLPVNTTGDGSFKDLNITAIVQKDRSFQMHFQLGMTGTYGYRVGYSTTGASPEFVGFQFQFTTTGTGKPAPASGQSTAVHMNSRQLAKAGFTKKVNTVGWGGTATISAHRVPAGAPVTIKGTAPDSVKPGTVLQLERFVATDKLGSGSFTPLAGIQTQVATDGTFSLTFEINERGRYGYTLGTPLGEEWVGMEFQLRTT